LWELHTYVLGIYPKIRKRWSFRLNFNGSVAGMFYYRFMKFTGRQLIMTSTVTENGFVVHLC
jgi:hypothetical protein